MESDTTGGVILKSETHKERLCSPVYQELMLHIGGYYKNAEALCKDISRYIKPAAKMLSIGYLSLHLDAPLNVFSPKGKHVERELYNAEFCPEILKHLEFTTAENGTCIFDVNSIKGYVWTDEEWEDVCFLIKSLFVLFGRARIGGLLTKANSEDFLTSALNTKGMIQYGETLRQKGTLINYVGMFMNLKNFKYINQTVGQTKGDEILVKYCRTLQGFLLPEEKIARPGGDNFFVIVLRERAEIFLKFVQEVPIAILTENGKRIYHISANIGIYQITESDNINTVMNSATIALNEVKHSGKGIDQLWYAPYMFEKIMHDKQVSQLFPKALADGEFLVYYQPKVTLENQMLCGCEALVRWWHDGQIVPPMEFIPVLEREGTVCNLDFFVFERACADLRRWLDMGIEPVRISVNFSQQHLHDDNLSGKILDIMLKYEIESRYIEVELTEMSGAKDHDAMLVFLQRMRDYGICTSIDDFGTGFSSLNMLRELRTDVIKLDKSFVDKITSENIEVQSDKIVIENIVHMVRALKLEIISEGVETKEQADFLRDIHCNMAQGFLFDKPLPHDEFEKRLLGSRVYHV